MNTPDEFWNWTPKSKPKNQIVFFSKRETVAFLDSISRKTSIKLNREASRLELYGFKVRLHRDPSNNKLVVGVYILEDNEYHTVVQYIDGAAVKRMNATHLSAEMGKRFGLIESFYIFGVDPKNLLPVHHFIEFNKIVRKELLEMFPTENIYQLSLDIMPYCMHFSTKESVFLFKAKVGVYASCVLKQAKVPVEDMPNSSGLPIEWLKDIYV